MEYMSPFLIAFLFIFLSELGDKTQLLVLTFSTKTSVKSVLLGVAVGSLLSHGIAILFGSSLASLGNSSFQTILQLITYASFIGFGIFSFLPEKENAETENPKGFLFRYSHQKLNYILMIAFSIAVGELGDKTFLASIGLGIQYPSSKMFLILGSVLGMLVSNFFAILLGKMLSKKISTKTMNILSGILFLAFGLLGLLSFLFGSIG